MPLLGIRTFPSKANPLPVSFEAPSNFLRRFRWDGKVEATQIQQGCMRNNSWQWDNRSSWKKSKNRMFWFGFNRARRYESNYRRTLRRGKLIGFFWGVLWCVQIIIVGRALMTIVRGSDDVVTRQATIVQ